jgi:Uncharacterized membrane protein, putative virulence factor
MLAMAFRREFRYVASFQFRNPHVTSVGRLLVRPLIGAGMNPLARVGEQLFTSFMPSGSITILNYGYRLISAIGGSVMFRSVIIAIVPRLTSATARGDKPEVRRTTRLGVKIMLLLSLPLTAFMAVLSIPAAHVVFQRKRFSRQDAMMLGILLAVYSLSLVGSAVQRAMLAPFFSKLDTRTPLRNTIYGVTANLVLLPLCVLPFGRTENGIFGIAIAYSLAQYVNVAHAWYHMKRDLDISMHGMGATFWRLTGASLLSGAAMVGGYFALGMNQDVRTFTSSMRWALLVKTVLDGLLGFGVLVGALALFGRGEVRQLLSTVRKPRSTDDPDTGLNDEGT